MRIDFCQTSVQGIKAFQQPWVSCITLHKKRVEWPGYVNAENERKDSKNIFKASSRLNNSASRINKVFRNLDKTLSLGFSWNSILVHLLLYEFSSNQFFWWVIVVSLTFDESEFLIVFLFCAWVGVDVITISFFRF